MGRGLRRFCQIAMCVVWVMVAESPALSPEYFPPETEEEQAGQAEEDGYWMRHTVIDEWEQELPDLPDIRA